MSRKPPMPEVRHTERCASCGKRFVLIDLHRQRCAIKTFVAYENPALTPQENKAVEMHFNHFSRVEIADEMDISNRHLNRLLANARAKGVAIPYETPGNRHHDAVPIEDILELRARLHAEGILWGVYPIMAQRLGMTANAIKVRIWKHEHMREQAA